MSSLQPEYHHAFEKQLVKLSKKQRDKVIDAIVLFLEDQAAPSLRNHALTGEWRGFRSISAGGDLRVHFQITGGGTVAYFVAVGTHSQLYK
jgi:addiction module RelE/StbE family toxin